MVRRAAKYAVAEDAVFCSRKVASIARRRVAGAFWWARDEDVCGRIFESAVSMVSAMSYPKKWLWIGVAATDDEQSL